MFVSVCLFLCVGIGVCERGGMCVCVFVCVMCAGGGGGQRLRLVADQTRSARFMGISSICVE